MPAARTWSTELYAPRNRNVSPFDIYRELSGTWERLRSDIIAHLVLAGILYLSGFRPPDLESLGLDPSHLLGGRWHELLGSVGLPITLAAVAALVLFVYTLLLRTVGAATANALEGLLGPPQVRLLDDRAKHTLGIVAASIPEAQLDPRSLERTLRKLMDEIRTTRPDRVAPWLDSLARRHSDRWTIFHDSCFFAVAWLLLPMIGLSANVWTEGDGSSVGAFFLIVLFVLVAHNLLALSYAQLERDHLLVVAHALESGEEGKAIKTRLESDFPAISQVVDKLIADRQRHRRKPPSLWRYLLYRFPKLHRRVVVMRARRLAVRRWWQSFQDQAQLFEFETRRSKNYNDSHWLKKYLRWRLAKIGKRIQWTARWWWERIRP